MCFRQLYLASLTIIVLFSSCKKDSMEPDLPGPPPSGSSQVDVQGSVISGTGAQVAGATVECNGVSGTTDGRGVFILRNVPVHDGVNFVRVQKSGFFRGGRNFQVVGSEPVAVRVKLLSKVLTGTFQASAGGAVSTPDGLAVSIPANAIANGYQGEVRVYATNIDPTDIAGVSPIPGMECRNASGEEGVMISYGMGNIELEDGAGNPLQLADGGMAQLTFPIPASTQGNAPNTIPLWYFDETTGYWQEEGSATLQGTNYVGEVAHFTLWNCDDFSCPVDVTVTITCNGEPYAYLPVRISCRLGGVDYDWNTGVTSPSGILYATIPCGAEMHLYAMAPGSEDETSIGQSAPIPSQDGRVPITMAGLCTPHGSVHGSAVTGSGQPVTNGYVYLNYGSFFTEPIFFDDQGNFNAFYYGLDNALWNTDAQLVGWDLDQYITVQGPTVQFNGEQNTLVSPLVFGGGSASVNGRIFLASQNSSGNDGFHCLDASDGSQIWSYDASQMNADVSPIYADNLIVFRNLSGLQYALNAFDGSQVWSGSDPDGMSPFYADGVIYFATQSGTIRARNAVTGASLWTYNAGAGLYSAPSVVGNVLYCGSGSANPRLIALDKSTGDLLWEYGTSSEINTSPCVADGKVFFGTDDQVVHALDAGTGSLLWESTVDDCTALEHNPTAGNGIVYVQACSELHALDMGTGADVWSLSIVSASNGNDPYLYNGRLYVGGSMSAPGWFHCLDAATGNVLWNLEGNGATTSADHCVAVNDVLLIHRRTAPQTLEARNASTGDLIWTSPVEEDLIAPMVLVDDNGEAHYCTVSGMQQ